MNKSFLDRLAVCSWSLQPAHPQNLLQQTQQIGIPRLQCALDPLREHPAAWGQFPEQCTAAGITLVSGMFGTIGEDYSTLETIRQTGGVVPDATWAENWKNIQATASLAEQIGLKLITFHAGFLPHEETDPAFQKLFDRISRIADLFASRNIALGFETGQETAETLLRLSGKTEPPDGGREFDPANMILYDKAIPSPPCARWSVAETMPHQGCFKDKTARHLGRRSCRRNRRCRLARLLEDARRPQL